MLRILVGAREARRIRICAHDAILHELSPKSAIEILLGVVGRLISLPSLSNMAHAGKACASCNVHATHLKQAYSRPVRYLPTDPCPCPSSCSNLPRSTLAMCRPQRVTRHHQCKLPLPGGLPPSPQLPLFSCPPRTLTCLI